MHYQLLKQVFKLQEKTVARLQNRLLIFMHDYPDPDSISSAFLLKAIAKHFKWNSKIVYGGRLTRSENIQFVKKLGIPIALYHKGEEKKYALTALVDCQKGMGNNIFPEHLTPSITFDHHDFTPVGGEKKVFRETCISYGATASILMQYFLHYKIPLTRRIATSYCYALTSETDRLNRHTSNMDIRLYKQALATADLKMIATIENSEKPQTFFEDFKKALACFQIKHRVVYCMLGKVQDSSSIHQIADSLVIMEGMYFSLVTAIVDGKGFVCARSKYAKVGLGRLVKEALKGVGKGGGHDMVAAGNFEGAEKGVIDAFLLLVE